MSAAVLPDCPQCGRAIHQAERVGVSAAVELCGHFIPTDFFGPSHVESGVQQELVADGGQLQERQCTTCGKSVEDAPYERWLFGTCASCAAEPAPHRWSYGVRNYTVIELLDEATACTLDKSEFGLSVEEIRLGTRDGGVREVEFPRTTGDVSELVDRGDRIITPPDREQKVRSVTEPRSYGLPVWSVEYCDVDDDLLSGDLPPRGQSELIARDGEIYRSFGRDPLGAPAFEDASKGDPHATMCFDCHGRVARVPLSDIQGGETA